MARAFRGTLNESAQKDLKLTELFPNCVSIGYSPSQELLNNSSLSELDRKEALSKKHELLLINGQDDFISIYPINTLPMHSDFLKGKYDVIESITLEGFGYNTPDNIDEILELLEELPSGFVKDYEFGLGLLKDYRTIINSIEDIPSIKHLVITKINSTKLENEFYNLSFSDFETIRKGINRISSDYQSKSRIDKTIFSYNALLHQLDSSAYPERKKKYKNDVVYKLLTSTSFDESSLSKKDSNAVLNILSNNKSDIYKNTRKEAVQLQQDIELLNLSWVVDESKRLLTKKSSESEWQNFFNDNPLILFLVFGYPVVKIKDQATVGGRKLSGPGDKITDFLIKNNLSNNCALIEIKKPSTTLLNSKEYRGGVFSPSSELSGSINQILDQKHKFQKEISLIKDNSGIYDIESYAVDCVLIIGTMPFEKEKKKSFEMFRHNSKDVRIYTFDELVHKLKDMYLLLKGNEK